MRELTTWFSALDALALVAFMVFSWTFTRFRVNRVVDQIDADNVTPADFGAQVRGLPRFLGTQSTHRHYEEKLRAHLERQLRDCCAPEQLRRSDYAKQPLVQEVALIRDYEGSIHMYMQKGEVLKAIRGLKASKLQLLSDGVVH